MPYCRAFKVIDQAADTLVPVVLNISVIPVQVHIGYKVGGCSTISRIVIPRAFSKTKTIADTYL